MLLLLRAKLTLLARHGTESLVWRNVAWRLHREADTQGEEEEVQKKKELHKPHSGSPDIPLRARLAKRLFNPSAY